MNATASNSTPLAAAAANDRRAKLLLCFAIVYLVWGSSYLATAIGVRHLPPLLFGGIRFAIGGLLLTLLAVSLGRRIVVDRAELKNLTVVAIGAVLMSNGLSAWAMQWVASNQAALLNATSALWIAVLATRGRRAHSLTPLTAAGLVIGFLGAALIIWPRGAWSASHMPQQFAILGGVFGWAVATVYMRNAVTKLDVLTFTGLQMFLGGLMLIGCGLAFGEAARWQFSRDGLVAMAYLTLMSSCVAYTAYGYLTKHTTPALVGTYGYVNPAIAAVLGWAFLQERLGVTQLVGMAVMLGGVALVSWPRKESQPEPPG
jgi:drug/metabolite transporter (DMT)-like permease